MMETLITNILYVCAAILAILSTINFSWCLIWGIIEKTEETISEIKEWKDKRKTK